MDISVSTGLYYKKSYTQILDMISRTSCKNIELFLNQAFIDIPINELEKQISKRNLNIISVHTPLEFIAFPRKQSEEYWIKRSIEITKIFNSKVVVTHMVNGNYYIELPYGLDKLHKDNILKYKNLKDVYITTENLPYLKDKSFLAKQDEFIEFVKKNDVNITFDTTHCAARGLSIIDEYYKLKNNIKNIHLSDFKDGAEHKILGNGELPLIDFLSILKKDNYDGIITIELDFVRKVII
jgi:sugar phosphate isomerase/epimerase